MNDELKRRLTQNRLLLPKDENDPWQGLAMFESQSLVSEFYRNLHQSGIGTKAVEITSHVTQGRQYFEAAARSGEFAKPLLLYYGVLSLARATVMFLTPRIGEPQMSPKHGLDAVQWREDLAFSPTELLNVQISLGGGTFREFLKATGNMSDSNVPRTDTMADHGQVVQCFPGEAVHGTVRVGDVLSRIPELRDVFETASGENSNAIPSIVELHGNYGASVLLIRSNREYPNLSDAADFLDLPQGVELTANNYDYRIGDVPHLQYWTPNRSTPWMLNGSWSADTGLPPITNDDSGMVYVIRPFPGGFSLAPLLLLFAASYASGMLARYFPSFWGRMLAGRGDNLLPLLRLLNLTVEHNFPALILQRLQFRPQNSAL